LLNHFTVSATSTLQRAGGRAAQAEIFTLNQSLNGDEPAAGSAPAHRMIIVADICAKASAEPFESDINPATREPPVAVTPQVPDNNHRNA